MVVPCQCTPDASCRPHRRQTKQSKAPENYRAIRWFVQGLQNRLVAGTGGAPGSYKTRCRGDISPPWPGSNRLEPPAERAMSHWQAGQAEQVSGHLSGLLEHRPGPMSAGRTARTGAQPVRDDPHRMQAGQRALQQGLLQPLGYIARAMRRAASGWARSGEYWVYLTDEQARWR